jgi:hypothetical protein
MVNYTLLHSFSWLVSKNLNSETATTNSIQLLDVQKSFRYTTLNANQEWQIEYSGHPLYSVNMTTDLLRTLNSRPKALTDFQNGHTTATASHAYEFGDDLGYVNPNCKAGYWPPGPSCPKYFERRSSFTLNPTENLLQKSMIGLGPIGLFVNGIAIYGFKDSFSYKHMGTWDNIATEMERYDMDICDGHSDPSGTYHHHHFSSCLAKRLNDKGATHSPIYGWLNDGKTTHHESMSLFFNCCLLY